MVSLCPTHSKELSVIIPTLDAAHHLPACLHALRHGPRLTAEIIVCDGGSHDHTFAICTRNHIRYIAAAGNGRGRQFHTAAMAARGTWLLFLHADTRLDTHWPETVSAHMRKQPHHAACFRLAFDSQARQARILEALVALRVTYAAMPYGDQGLLISKDLYDQLGGFRNMTFLEDVDFVRRIGAPRLDVLDCNAITSSERYEKDGWMRRSTRNAFIVLRYFLGASPEKLARVYE